MTTQETATSARRRPIEYGWLALGDLTDEELGIVHRAREQMLASVTEQFPEFDWRMPLVERVGVVVPTPAEAARLLQEGLAEQDALRWDFTLVVTGADLRSYYKPYALAMPSRALGVAVVSLARLRLYHRQARGGYADPGHAADRLCTLALHLLGDLNGIEHVERRGDFMYAPREAGELDAMHDYPAETRERLAARLAEVADIRLEEQASGRPPRALAFYARAVWHLRGDIASAVRQAQPWEFPFRLSRLTTAALSTLLILLMTAEAWDLGMSQPLALITPLSLAVLTGASAFLVTRQRLLLRRPGSRLSERIVINNIAIGLIVFVGMTTTYLTLFALTLALAALLFSHDLVVSWAASLSGEVGFGHYLAMAQLVASLGILIGSLGAAFEGQDYIRHVAYIDEEL